MPLIEARKSNDFRKSSGRIGIRESADLDGKAGAACGLLGGIRVPFDGEALAQRLSCLVLQGDCGVGRGNEEEFPVIVGTDSDFSLRDSGAVHFRRSSVHILVDREFVRFSIQSFECDAIGFGFLFECLSRFLILIVLEIRIG